MLSFARRSRDGALSVHESKVFHEMSVTIEIEQLCEDSAEVLDVDEVQTGRAQLIRVSKDSM